MSPSCLYVQMSSEFAGTSCAKDAFALYQCRIVAGQSEWHMQFLFRYLVHLLRSSRSLA